MAKKATTQKAKSKKNIRLSSEGKVFVTATFNNTIVTVTDVSGKVIAWGSAGTAGFKGSRKSTPFAATTSVQQIAQNISERGLERVEVFIKGIGMGRDAAIRALKAAGIEVTSIADISPMPHNGCRPPKRRRV